MRHQAVRWPGTLMYAGSGVPQPRSQGPDDANPRGYMLFPRHAPGCIGWDLQPPRPDHLARGSANAALTTALSTWLRVPATVTTTGPP
jgi:hypothetical protein